MREIVRQAVKDMMLDCLDCGDTSLIRTVLTAEPQDVRTALGQALVSSETRGMASYGMTAGTIVDAALALLTDDDIEDLGSVLRVSAASWELG